jgi:ectoine hydroxylase-related dioxygenase (phytanoyl-CoA dioxygenase family)
VAFPVAGTSWNVPDQVWHLDAPVSGSDPRPPGLRAFAFLDKVEPRGGATAVVTGSHRRVYELARQKAPQSFLRSKKVRNQLAVDEPWIKDLFEASDLDTRIERFMKCGVVSQGIPLRVVEATGEPGDITLMDLRCLHAPAVNATRAPRLVIGHAFHTHRHISQAFG